MAAVLLALLISPAAATSSEAAQVNDTALQGYVLIDMGNGNTYWCEAPCEGTYLEVVAAAAESLGLDFESSGGEAVTIGNMTNHYVGTSYCYWIAYSWDGLEWVAASQSTVYDGTSFAFGFYPDESITPSETPDDPTAWTMYGGSSSLTNVSDSYGTTEAVTPVEWYNTYTTGYVDSAIVAAGQYLYHTTNGEYYGDGTDAHAWLYCLDKDDGEIIWSFDLSAGGDTSNTDVRSPSGYDITTPVVVGDMIVCMSSNQWSSGDYTVMHMYLLDRYTGELLADEEIVHSPPLDDNGDVVWTGRTFVTGGTTPIYDSGALYFGTSDGRILCYSVSYDDGFELLWECVPDSSTDEDGNYTGSRGSFYFHAPVITDVDGERTLFIGNYEGYLFSIDPSTGEINWEKQLINLGDDNIVPGTPGSIATIAVTDDGRLLVECTDGAMVTTTGYLICIDASTGSGPDGSDYYWKIDGVFAGPVVDGDYFYCYATAASSGDGTFTMTDGTVIDVDSAIYKFNLDGEVVWVSENTYPLVKATPTLADGVLYTVDYSAGSLYPSGGCVTAISAEDGTEIWRLWLEPYSTSSYNMCSVTVIDGKLYVGNDYGAVYCISTIAGEVVGGSTEIVLEGGLNHWSWILLFLVVVVSVVAFWRLYPR